MWEALYAVMYCVVGMIVFNVGMLSMAIYQNKESSEVMKGAMIIGMAYIIGCILGS